ncbi:hypothetical protein Trydic_g22519 [Trypoxylus dichotomus]
MVQNIQRRTSELHNEQRSGRGLVSHETIAKVEEAMLKDRRVAVRELCKVVADISKIGIDKILIDHLGCAQISAKWVPRMLTKDGNILKQSANFFRATKPMARNTRTLLSLGTRPGSTTRYRK